MKPATFKNPIVKGAYPDPSICRVGEDYYLVASSFYYFPGLPIFKSRDLVHWEQIGNALSRPEQLDFQGCESSEGIWAPTIRYHEGTFYIATTLCTNGRQNQYNFVITAKDPAGEWSNAVIIEGADGIDPSLYFDEEGRIWYCSNRVPTPQVYPSQKEIYLCELDKETFQMKSEPIVIWDGAVEHSDYTEAPHIYKHNDMYYLVTANGGTQTNHCVHMARSKNLTGPYEVCPRNPVITQRNIRLNNNLGISVIGHGDLVETQNGEWYMVLLGIRPYYKVVEDYDRFLPRMWIRTPDRNKDAQFNLGREIFLLPVAWEYDGWLIADNDNGLVNPEERKPNLPWYRRPNRSRMDNFENVELAMEWCSRRVLPTDFMSLTEREGWLRLYLQKTAIDQKDNLSMIVRRQQDNNFQAACSMEFTPEQEEEAGLIVIQNERYAYGVVKTLKDGEPVLSVFRIVNGKREEVYSEPVHPGKVYLTLEGREGFYQFLYGYKEFEMIPLGEELDASLLSTVVADGFIGSYLGMYASSKGKETANYADFDWFRYEMIEQ